MPPSGATGLVTGLLVLGSTILVVLGASDAEESSHLAWPSFACSREALRISIVVKDKRS